MVIFHSYVKLPEGSYRTGAPLCTSIHAWSKWWPAPALQGWSPRSHGSHGSHRSHATMDTKATPGPDKTHGKLLVFAMKNAPSHGFHHFAMACFFTGGLMVNPYVNLSDQRTYFIWVNYNNSLTWNKAIWGWFPLLTMIPVRSQWGRYNLPRFYLWLHWSLPHPIEWQKPTEINHGSSQVGNQPGRLEERFQTTIRKKKNEGNRKCNEAMNIYNSYNSNLFLLYSKTVKLNQSVGSHTQWNVSRHSPFHTFTFTSWFPEKTAQVDALPWKDPWWETPFFWVVKMGVSLISLDHDCQSHNHVYH